MAIWVYKSSVLILGILFTRLLDQFPAFVFFLFSQINLLRLTQLDFGFSSKYHLNLFLEVLVVLSLLASDEIEVVSVQTRVVELLVSQRSLSPVTDLHLFFLLLRNHRPRDVLEKQTVK